MLSLFKNKILFSVLFFLMIIIDSYVKIALSGHGCRYATKLSISIVLILFFIQNHSEVSRIKFYYMILALVCFLLGDFFFIDESNMLFFSLGMGSFILGKLFYILNFSHYSDFKFTKLFPLILICIVYGFGVMHFILPNLNEFYVPVILYFFVALMVLIFAFLRQWYVNKKSFFIVFSGVVISLISDTLIAIDTFAIRDFIYENIATMLFYGLSQYLIVFGVTEAVLKEHDDVL